MEGGPQYGKVQRRIWNDEVFRMLTQDEKMFLLYLLTCPHGNILGCFVLKPGYAMEDLGWNRPHRIKKSLDRIQKIEKPYSNCQPTCGLVVYDSVTNLILISKYLEHNRLANPNQEKAAVKVLRELPYSAKVFHELKLIAERLGFSLLAKEIREVIKKRNGSTNG